MGCCSSVSNEVSEPRPQNPPNLQGPLPATSFRSMIRPPQNSQQDNQHHPIKKSASRIRDFQQGNSSPQQKKFVLTEEEERREKSLEHKNRGNTYFKNRNYVYASQEYSKAIEIYNKDAIYYSNRALCFKFLCQFDKVIIDAEMSIKLTPNNYKAFHLKGIALMELGKNDEKNEKITKGIESLSHSLGLVMKQADKEIINEISTKVNKAKKLKWLKEKQESEQKNNKTLAFLNSLINKDQAISSSQKKEKLALVQQFADEKSQIKSVSEVPETLCCKITFEMIQNPALSPSGVTYENDILVEHLRKTGDFDPCTRQQIRSSDLMKNKTLTKAILQFQHENPWCFDSGTPYDDYRTINFN